MALLIHALLPTAGAAAQEAEPAAGVDKAESLPVPDGTVKELLAFVDELIQQEPENRDEQAITEHTLMVARTLVKASDAILSKKPNDRDATDAVSLRLQALNMLRRLEEPGAEAAFDKAVAEARADKRSGVAALGMKYYIESGFERWPSLTPGKKRALIDTVATEFDTEEIGNNQINLLLSVTGFLSDMSEEKLAGELFDRVLPRLRDSVKTDEQAEAVKMLEGIARRIDLLGKPLELSGAVLGGGELDWESYRGRVVLVDFWASWCGPCRSEVPNVLRNYEAYHEKGFDVVGVNLDKTEEQALAYIEQTKIPWKNLFSKDKDHRGWQHPMAVYYGVNGIPRAMLVDREGKVVSMQARGEELGTLLRKLLGEPVVKTSRRSDTIVGEVAPAAYKEP